MSPSFPLRLKPPEIHIPLLFVNIANRYRPRGVYTEEGDIFSQKLVSTWNMCKVPENSLFASIPPNK